MALSTFHREMRSSVIDEGLVLDANCDAVIKLAEERLVAVIVGLLAQQADKCCDNCNCVALADLLHSLRH